MKFTLSWLKDHLETNATLDEIVQKLTALGLEVESLDDPAAKFAPFRVAYVEKAEKHPDADRLRVCVVDTGSEKLQVVCGAPNARTGMKAVFAPVSSVIPGTGLELKKGSIRGQESCGMLVSEREMGFSDEHEGIIDLPENTPVGTPLAKLYGLDDPVIEINLTPNRADCAGVRGIARDLAAAGLGTLKPLDEKPVKGVFKSNIGVRLEFNSDDANACPHFIGRQIRGVKNGPSPEWLQKRLKAIGLRPISALVDITNYVSYDLCRPLHVFDADKLAGDITVRLAKKGETLEALNEKAYELDDFMTAVCDSSSVAALGGVMGGVKTGCTEETKNVFLEVAYFDPHRTARTGRALQIVSDARYRFERGVDPAFLEHAAEIATKLILDLCGGEASEVVTAGAAIKWQRDIAYPPSLVKKLAGFDIEEQKQKEILSSLGFTVKESKEQWLITPPSWRGDIEGKADIVEEIVRTIGYDSIPPVSVPKNQAITQPAESAASALSRNARTTLAARGLNETVTWSFLPHQEAEKFGANDGQAAASLRLVNPISADMDQMRPSILPNLLAAAARNDNKGLPDAALFEVGPVFSSAKIKGQLLVVGGLRAQAAGPRHWTSSESARDNDAFDAKADALAVIESCGGSAASLQVTRDAPGWYHPGRSGALRLGPNVIAYFGELHPALTEESGLAGRVAAFEVFLDRIPQKKKKEGTAKKLLILPPFQPLRRDFAFIVDEKVEAEQIVRAAAGADKNLITAVDVFDVYAGKGIDPGKKSVAINVTIQPREKTMTDAEIEDIAGKITGAVAAKTDGTLRS